MTIAVTVLVVVAAGLFFGLLMSGSPLDSVPALTWGPVLAGAAVIAVELVRVWLQARLADTGVRTEGEVVDVVEVGKGSRPDLSKYAVVVRFRTTDGGEVTAGSGKRQSYFRSDIDKAIAADPETGLRRTGHQPGDRGVRPETPQPLPAAGTVSHRRVRAARAADGRAARRSRPDRRRDLPLHPLTARAPVTPSGCR